MPRTVACASCPLRASGHFRALAGSELEFIEEFKIGELTVEAGGPLILEGSNSPHLYTLFQGWAFRFKTLADGRRQVLNYVMRGDFVGLQSSLFNTMGHGVEALTPVRLCVFPRDRLWRLFERHPALGFDITWLAAREERSLDELLLSIGRRTAIEKLAFTICFLYSRAQGVGLVENGRLQLPITQQLLADTIGMSVVHTNKTLQRLRAMKCIRWDRGELEIVDEDKLFAIAETEREEPPGRPLI